jgi:hypothetical protein
MMMKGLDFKNTRKGEGDEVVVAREESKASSSSSPWGWDSGIEILAFMGFRVGEVEGARRLVMASYS